MSNEAYTNFDSVIYARKQGSISAMCKDEIFATWLQLCNAEPQPGVKVVKADNYSAARR
jgi:hypothetical protein